MNSWDWGVVALYLMGILAAGLMLGRSHNTVHDYYLAGRRIRWWQSGLSTMATQLGAISFVSAPAFVALKQGGGLKWLAYEFGVPLALILVMAVIIPVFHRTGQISIYEYLETRFDRGTRSLVSVLFQVGRGLATAVSVLAGGLIISTALNIPTTAAIIVIGAVTIAYDALGGIRIVILSDVFQMAVIVIGIIVCGGLALSLVGWEQAWGTLEPARLKVLDFSSWGIHEGGTYAFWPMTVGGIFLYASYYGCDQSQVQRELSVGSVDHIRRSLLVNAFGRFLIVALYCVMGVLVGAVVAGPQFVHRAASAVGSSPATISAALDRDPDRMVPLFILSYLPHGVTGFIFVAILSALMSSLDSGLNSLSAVTIRDFYQRYWSKDRDEGHYLLASKLCTMAWGVFCVGAALAFAASAEATRQTTIVLINAIGSVLYGPILAAFLLGMLTRWAGPQSTKLGVIAGVGLNIVIWQLTSISWLWWNVTGFAGTVAVSLLLSDLDKRTVTDRSETAPIHWSPVYVAVLVYFFVMVGISYLIEKAV